MKQFVIRTFLLLIISAALGGPTGIFANEKATIVGTLVARERNFGHIYRDDEVVSTRLIVRVEKVLAGSEPGKYVFVKYHWTLNKMIKEVFDNALLQGQFDLRSTNGCGKSLRDQQFAFFGPATSKTGLNPRFFRSAGAELEPLPLDVRLPCYEMIGKFTVLKVGPPRPTDQIFKDTELFVLEDSLTTTMSGSPVRATLEPGGDVLVTATTGKTLKYAKLGCISNDEELLQSWPESRRANVFWGNSNGVPNDIQILYSCYRKNGKIAAIEGVFEDGSTWVSRR